MCPNVNQSVLSIITAVAHKAGRHRPTTEIKPYLNDDTVAYPKDTAHLIYWSSKWYILPTGIMHFTRLMIKSETIIDFVYFLSEYETRREEGRGVPSRRSVTTSTSGCRLTFRSSRLSRWSRPKDASAMDRSVKCRLLVDLIFHPKVEKSFSSGP